MKFIENDYVMAVIPSKNQFLAWCITSIILHLILAVILSRLSLATIVVNSISILSYIMTIIIMFLVKRPSFQLTINERGDFSYKSHMILSGKLLSSSFSTNWFIWLGCEIGLGINTEHKIQHILIWRDALDDQSFRRLARIIRLKRQMI